METESGAVPMFDGSFSGRHRDCASASARSIETCSYDRAPDARSFLREVDVVSNPRLAGTVDQSDQGSPLGAAASPANENDDSVVWVGLSQHQEIVAIAADDHTSISSGVFKNFAILSRRIKNIGYA